jgi:hypothetical protein
VTAVSKVQIRKPTENERQGRKVKADISVETWVVARKGEGPLNPTQSNQIMPGSDPARAVYDRLGLRGRVALVIGLLAAVALVWWLSTLIWAMLLPAASTASAQADEKRRLAELEEKFAQQIAQFNGRTVFYVPAPPQDEPKVEAGPAEDDGPAPPPRDLRRAVHHRDRQRHPVVQRRHSRQGRREVR